MTPKHVFTEEHRRKISEAKKGHSVSDETRKKLSEKIKGFHHTDEARKKISEGLKNSKRIYYVSPETREKIRQSLSGRKLTKKHSENISKALLNKEAGWITNKHQIGVKRSQECKNNISKGNKGKKRTEEQKEKLSQAHLTKSYFDKMGGDNNPSKKPENRLKISLGLSKIQHTKFDNGCWSKVGYRKDLGHCVRSSWEANICRLLKYLNIPYEYEKKRFTLLKDGKEFCSYLPDFYLPTHDVWLEVKGWLQLKDTEKILCFIENNPQYKFCYCGGNQYKEIYNLCCSKIPNWEK